MSSPRLRVVSALCQSAGRSCRGVFDGRQSVVLVMALLTVHAALLAVSATKHSPTLNEPAHLVAGLAHWKFQRFELFRVNPPLVRLVAALPVMAAGYRADWSRFNEFPGARYEADLGQLFMHRNGARAVWLFSIARWACIPFSLLGGMVCYAWAKELYGLPAGLLSLGLWCFCPTILGHGSLITPDVAGTSTFILACYLLWKWQAHPTWKLALLIGLALGGSCLAKSTSLVILPVVFVALGAGVVWRHGVRALWQLCLIGGLGLYVIHLGYFFEKTLVPLGEFEFVSESLAGPKAGAGRAGNRFRGTVLAHIPVPLPASYVRGIDIQRRDFEDYGHPSYLRGEWRDTGWWYYYLYGLMIKIPLGTWGIVLLALLHPGRPPPAALWLPSLAVLALVSSQDGFSQHFRYVLQTFPLLFILAGRAVCGAPPWRCGLALTFLIWTVASSLWFFPHGLAYFNELAGGPRGGREHMIHSSLDWGQDLLYLRRWQERHPEVPSLKLLYLGEYDPADLGIRYTLPAIGGDGRIELHSGWYAISVNYLQGYPYSVYDGDGHRVPIPMHACDKLESRVPDDVAGCSIYLYEIDGRAPISEQEK